MKRLEGKVTIITGAAGDIGKTTAKRFVEEGSKVMLVDIAENKLSKIVDELGKDNAGFYTADVTDPEDNIDYVKSTLNRFGKIDVFINNAAIEGEVKPIKDYSYDVFSKLIDINIKGAWLGLKYVMPEMEDNGGSIIMTSSVAGVMGTPGVSAYVTSKHGLIGMMKTAALEGAPNNIRVNSINPAPIDSRMMDSLEEGFSPEDKEQSHNQFSQQIPLQRYGTLEEVANFMLFLASDESSYCTGGVYMVDGGMTA